MKAISLWQPWASAIAIGSKRIETRGWATSYRGPLAIHAAKRCVKSELHNYSYDGHWHAAMFPLKKGHDLERPLWEFIPFGAIIAICYLSDCRRAESFPDAELDAPRKREGMSDTWTERMMGHFWPGRWGWVLDHIRSLKAPLPYKGMQGLFDVPDQLLEKACEA
jgi:hypothetical protein